MNVRDLLARQRRPPRPRTSRDPLGTQTAAPKVILITPDLGPSFPPDGLSLSTIADDHQQLDAYATPSRLGLIGHHAVAFIFSFKPTRLAAERRPNSCAVTSS